MKEEILIQNVLLKNELVIPTNCNSLIIFVCLKDKDESEIGKIAEYLNMAGFGTIRIKILNDEEYKNRSNSVDLDLLTERIIGITKWYSEEGSTKNFNIGYFGVGLGSAVAFSAAAYWGTKIKAIVSWNGRPDLALDELDLIEAPALLIVEKNEQKSVEQNRKAYLKIGSVKKIEVTDNTIEKVSSLSASWFLKYLLGESLKEGVATISQKNRPEKIT